MKDFIKKVIYIVRLCLSITRLLPHIVMLRLSKNRELIKLDTIRWMEIFNKGKESTTIQKIFRFEILMTFSPEYRNLFYNRLGGVSLIISWLCPPVNTLFLTTTEIGSGLFIQHGFSTVVSAKSIGKNCWINQQVTIGFSNATDCPTLGNNVTVNAGAKVIGNVIVGDNSIIGANAVVVKSVPPNCTVVGIPAYIVKRNGIRVNEKL